MKTNLHPLRMIILFTCFFTVTIALSVSSQTYHKLIRTNTFWDNFITDVQCYLTANRVCFTNNDTIIQGNTYRISRQYAYQTQDTTSGLFCPPFVVSNTYGLGTFLREDTILKKVYINEPYDTPHDQLLYDFSLQVGDTLQSFYNGNYTLVLTSIDTVTLNNGDGTRKRFSFNHNPLVNYIEGIGGSQGLFNPIFITENMGGYFCINDNGTNIWGDQCSYFFVGTDNLPLVERFSITPNPAHSYFTVHLGKPIKNANLQLFNLSGQLLISTPITESETKIMVDCFSQGLYLTQLTSNEGIVKGKILIK